MQGDASAGHSVQLRRHDANAAVIAGQARRAWDELGRSTALLDLSTSASVELADSEAARMRLERERSVPLSSVHQCRMVLIAYPDRQVDIVVSADRRALGYDSLIELARRLSDAGTVARRSGDCDRKRAARERLVSSPDVLDQVSARSDRWGLGGMPSGRGRGEIKGGILHCADDANLISAIAFTLSRFRGGGSAITSHPAVGRDDGDVMRTIVWPDEGGRSVERFMDACRAAARREVGRTYAEAQAALRDRGVEIDAACWFDAVDGPRRPPDGVSYHQNGAISFPFSISVEWTTAGAMHLVYDFDRTAYDPAMVMRFDRCIHRVLHQLEELPAELFVDTLSLGTAEDMLDDARLGGFGRANSIDRAAVLSDAFRTIAARTPSSPALSCDGETLTYRALDALVTTMAAHLRRAGVRPAQRVGVCLDRSLMIVPLFAAILRSGATYVPIDPRSPPARQRYIAEDAELALLVMDDIGIAGCDVPSLKLSDLTSDLIGGSGDDDACEADGKARSRDPAPAYIIYTSGSTGRPKGVLVSQQSVLSLIHATRDDFDIQPSDRWTFFHSAAFDFATWEIWGCLLTGGHLVVVPYFVSRAPDEFLKLLRDNRITVLNQTPTAFAQLMAAHRGEEADLALRLVIFGGEPLDARTLLPWMDRYPESRCQLVNMYGITETTVHVTAETVTRRHALAGAATVGAPIPGWSVHIKDDRGRHLPPGLAGEIHVGGDGLAIGYWKLPDETAARFVDDPVLECRLYRSGDRGRLRPDGRLDHLGRIDTQVKLRGFRIELDEIRLGLLDQRGVDAAMVVLRTMGAPSEAAYLEAFVVSPDRTAAELRTGLTEILPEYMVPERLWVIDHFPLTANGKFDLAAATAICDALAAAPSPVVAPVESGGLAADGAAAALALIWTEVFGRTVAVQDNFFDLGGNSLTAVKLASAMRRTWSQGTSIRDIYVHQTPQRLAATLSNGS